LGLKKLLALIVFSILLLVPVGTQNAFALTERFDNIGGFTTQELVKPDFTVTGSNLINVIEFNGLGIVGGNSGFLDINESMTFTFNTNVINVNIDFVPGTSVNVEAFDSIGQSLGTVPLVGGSGFKNISALFGDVPISKFTLIGTSNGNGIVQISYDLGPSDTQLILTELQQINQRLDVLEEGQDFLTKIIKIIARVFGIPTIP